ncbi:hypothetical protein, partial [Lactobacillus crispatus]
KTVKQLKLRVGLIVFQYLRLSFFPDTFCVLSHCFFFSFIICVINPSNNTKGHWTNSRPE